MIAAHWTPAQEQRLGADGVVLQNWGNKSPKLVSRVMSPDTVRAGRQPRGQRHAAGVRFVVWFEARAELAHRVLAAPRAGRQPREQRHAAGDLPCSFIWNPFCCN